MSDGCLFCKVVSREIQAQIVLETEHAVAFKDLRPVAPTHLLVVPKEHIAAVAVAADDDGRALGEVLLAARTAAREAGLDEDGYRLVINNGENAGQTVFHLHVHVLGGRPFSWPPG